MASLEADQQTIAKRFKFHSWYRIATTKLTDTKDLGCRTNIDILNQFLELKDRFVIDAGCGAMAFTREIASLGARVLAIDPDSAQAELNRGMDAVPGLEFKEAGAEILPVDDDSVDGVFFIYSLHHVPASLYPAVFEEIFRVLKPDGFLYVIEPIGCPLNDVMMLFHDEEVERAAAQTALVELAAPRFKSADKVIYHSIREFDSYEDFATQFSSRTFNPGYTESDVRKPEVEALFELKGAPDYRFEAPRLAHCFQGLKSLS
ncbi:MAG: ubiquinone/menaquinone biosynthesis C-methylase UbiE [Mariniblastus sp.]|jgi:ubiquinone/menaquinone biosynthesis C-methylase UbiE